MREMPKGNRSKVDTVSTLSQLYGSEHRGRGMAAVQLSLAASAVIAGGISHVLRKSFSFKREAVQNGETKHNGVSESLQSLDEAEKRAEHWLQRLACGRKSGASLGAELLTDEAAIELLRLAQANRLVVFTTPSGRLVRVQRTGTAKGPLLYSEKCPSPATGACPMYNYQLVSVQQV